ncbi:MAG: hypothetical protein WCI75_12180 [candidate division NC10 bacterium]
MRCPGWVVGLGRTLLALALLCGGAGGMAQAEDSRSGGASPSRHSASLTPLAALPGGVEASRAADRLGDLAYHRHLGRRGFPPAYDFLQPLIAAPPTTVRVEKNALVFPVRGTRAPFGAPTLPTGSAPLPPSLVSTPDSRWVLAIFPYYFPPGRTTHHRVAVYSHDGVRGHIFDSQPTHVLRGYPDLLVAIDRLVMSTGYCEALRWSFRFYDLRAGTIAEYACPDAQCGDALFVALRAGGPYLLALESVEAAMQQSAVFTRLFILRPDGKPLAAGWFSHPLDGGPAAGGESCSAVDLHTSRSSFAIGKLSDVLPLEGETAWLLRFEGGVGESLWRLGSSPTDELAPRGIPTFSEGIPLPE